jgi:regulator of replication initiation timing
MKIETIVKSCANNTVKYSNGIRVTYDGAAVAEVSEEDGLFLLEKYAGQIFPEGKVVRPVVTPSKNTSVDGSEVENLRAQLQKANALVNDYKAQVGSAKENERVWRTKCQDLMMENTTLREHLGKPSKTEDVKEDEQKADEKKQAEDDVVKAKLEGKTVKELTSIAEEMKLPVEEYKLLNKKKLIDYIITKTNATT